MSTRVDAGPPTDSRAGQGGYVPAYGPVDAVLGYALFYVFVDRATPTVVDVLASTLPDVSPSTVRLGLAVVLWFVLVVTAAEQVRRQFVALGIADGEDEDRDTLSRVLPSEPQALAYVVLLVLGGLVAAWTFDGAIGTAVSLVRVVAALDPGALVLGELVLMVVFFVAFEVATFALDRLLVGGVRELLAEGGDGDGRR
jgi:hypothetical protein